MVIEFVFIKNWKDLLHLIIFIDSLRKLVLVLIFCLRLTL